MRPRWPLRDRRCRPKCRLLAIMLLLWPGADATLAIAGHLEVDDVAAFQQMRIKIHAVADELSAMRSRDVMKADKQSDNPTQRCAIRLAGDLASVEAKFDHLSVLVGSATGSIDGADPVLTRVLGADASALLEQLRFHRQMLALRKCSQDAAATTKGEEIARLYSDASLLVQAIIKKIGTSNLSR